ncbi:hypothetical protein KHC33_04120 [Methanospirillum sp. J.3.6.1-F.2.7.3]|uniref:SHOCT domain-containing protein n=1 Tax=Methanospirillum purgamenti TaxID=2834276 RepID=A0A8E7B2I9_9EURY|nr:MULTISPECIES: tetratricopeptide repeat protein [Methanospirillum]MDX8551773.1 tetratricopeptide repeat protein [Methanospirillum hungatei]QVV89709.1 hypothetical protein KHC33_04120 [Methanospirillum sp. J.3.6.1-F.2.7.3]
MGFFSRNRKEPDKDLKQTNNITNQLGNYELNLHSYEYYLEKLEKSFQLYPDLTKAWAEKNKEYLNARLITYLNTPNLPNNIDFAIKLANLYCKNLFITPMTFFGLVLFTSLYDNDKELKKYSQVILDYLNNYQEVFRNIVKIDVDIQSVDYGPILGQNKIEVEWDHGQFFDTKQGSATFGISNSWTPHYVIWGWIWQFISHLLVKLNQYDEALNYLKFLYEHKVDQDRVLVSKFRLLHDLGRTKEALDILDFILIKDPNDEWALNKRSNIFLNTNDYERALKDINTLYSLDPTLELKKTREEVIEKINCNKQISDKNGDIENQLKLKFASGELSEEEYIRKRKILELDQ